MAIWIAVITKNRIIVEVSTNIINHSYIQAVGV